MTLYHQSGMEELLRDTFMLDEEQYYIYADSAYFLRAWLRIAFDCDNLSEE